MLKKFIINGIDQFISSPLVRGRYFFSLESCLCVLKVLQCRSTCSTVSSFLLSQNLHETSSSFLIFVLKALKLLCPVIISISFFSSSLCSFSMLLLRLGSMIGKKSLVWMCRGCVNRNLLFRERCLLSARKRKIYIKHSF